MKIEPPRLKKKNISAAIAANVKRFYQQIKTDDVFGTHRSGDEGLVPQNGPPDWGTGQASLPDSSAHAAPCLLLQARQRRHRHPIAAALHGAIPTSCTRCAIYRAQLRPLRWVLEGLSPRDQATSPILRSRLLLAGRAARSGSATARPSHLACPFSKPHPRQEPWWFLPNERLESTSLPEWMKS